MGDSWTYQTIDNWTDVVQEKYTLEVSAVSDKGIQFTRKSEMSGAVVNVTETPDRNVIVGVSGTKGDSIQYSPNSGTYAFPFIVGKTWEVKTDYTANERSGTNELTAKVVGMEKVKVPAGEFTALKIIQGGFYKSTTNAGSGSGRMNLILWYVPAVKGVVKAKYEDTNWGGRPFNRITTELFSYKIN